MAGRVFPPAQYQVDIVEAILDEAVRLAHKYEQLGYDVIISRGITCKMIRRAVSIPVVAIDITYFDLIMALHEASLYGCDMEYLHYRGDAPRPADLNEMLRMLGIEPGRLHMHTFATGEEVDRILREKQPGQSVILGTGFFVIDRAEKLGFQTVAIASRREAFLNALNEAKQLLGVIHKSSVRSQQLQSLIEGFCAGLILLNDQKLVEYATDQALRLLGLDQGNVIALPFREVFGKTPLRNIFQRQRCRFQVDNGHFVAELQRLFWSSESNGYAICLRPAPEAAGSRPAVSAAAAGGAFAAKYSLPDLLGKSPAIEQLRKKIGVYGASDMTVLVCGESGVGKEIVANSLHNLSPRRSGPFVAINCAALPQSLLESELFGYEAGAFTGAKKEGHPGLFEQANGGTLFLDEISDVSLSAQAQLLRVLQEMTVRRVGGSLSIPLDVRVVAATNVDLWEQAQAGKFREDLFYRLNMLCLRLPPLRERKEDIPILFRAFVDRYRGEKHIPLDADGLGWLQNYDWPGNVRELLSCAQKFAMLWDEQQDATQLISEILEEFSLIRRAGGERDERLPAGERDGFLTIPVGTLEDMERSILRQLQKRYPNTRSKMARDLDISRTSLWKKLKAMEEE